MKAYEQEKQCGDRVKEIRELTNENLSFTTVVVRELQDYVSFVPPSNGPQKAAFATHYFQYLKHLQLLKYINTFIAMHQKIHKLFQFRVSPTSLSKTPASAS